MSQPPRPDGPWHPQGPSSFPGPHGPQQFGPGAHGPQQFGPGPRPMPAPPSPRPGPAQNRPPAPKPRVRPVGPLLLVLSAIGAIVAIFLPWNHGQKLVSVPGGGMRFDKAEMWNGLQQAVVNIENDRIYGWLMIIAYLVTALACLVCVIAAIVALASPGGRVAGPLAWAGVALGLLGTLGVFGGYAVLGALHEGEWGMWVYGFSFLPGLLGAIGVSSRKF